MGNTDPMKQFADWLWAAERDSGQEHPNAVCLATVSPSGAPSARMVLLKGFGPEGFTIFTNYESRKAHELDSSGQAALCFYWDKLQRQVRVEGSVARLSREDSEAYFQTRQRNSQISAWASPQSEEIPSMAFLQQRIAETEARFAGVSPLPLPDYWGGYLLTPARIEFWQQGDFRRHERIVYEKEAGRWAAKRLAP